MSGRAQQLRIVDPVLTNLLRGYSNAQFVGTNLLPIVNVNKESGKIPTFGKEAFRLYNTERAMRANSNILPVEARGSIDFVTTEHDASYPIDYREQQEDIFNTQKHGAFVAESAIMLRVEKLIADLVLNANNYPAGNKITLAGSDQFTHADSDPINTFETAKEAIRQKIAKRANTAVISAQSFKALKNHSKFLERIKYSQLGVVTVDLLKAVLDLKNIYVADAVFETDAGVVTDIWGDFVVVAYVPEQQSSVERSIFEPSFGYTLRKSGMPEADMYDGEGGKIQFVRSTDNLVPKILGADAGYLISDTNA